MRDDYRRITGGMKEFGHTGYDLKDTKSSAEFKKFYKQWQANKDSPRGKEFKALHKHIENLLEKQEDLEIENLWLKKQNMKLQKQLDGEERVEEKISDTRYYCSLETVLTIVLVIILAMSLLFIWAIKHF